MTVTNFRYFGIEKELYEQTLQGFDAEQIKKGDFLRRLGAEAFRKHYPSSALMAAEGKTVARQILIGGCAAARELDWPLAKTAKQISEGLLVAMREHDKDYIAASCALIGATVQCALMTDSDVDKVSERVLGVILKQSENVTVNEKELKKKVSHAAVKAAKSFPKKSIKSLEKILMGLLEEKCYFDDDGIHWL